MYLEFTELSFVIVSTNLRPFTNNNRWENSWIILGNFLNYLNQLFLKPNLIITRNFNVCMGNWEEARLLNGK